MDMLQAASSRGCGSCSKSFDISYSHADWVVGDTTAPNYFASTLETISGDDQLGLIEPRIHLTAVKPDDSNGPDLHSIFVKVCRLSSDLLAQGIHHPARPGAAHPAIHVVKPSAARATP